ncbi:MAG: hypothetical protein KC419_19265, partial [Anaerolineales bacterium]|nr:hypothetical protein [Anaerolineales bacterium]
DFPQAVDDTAVVLRRPSNDLLILAARPSGTMNVLDNDIDAEDTTRSVIGVGDPDQGGDVSIDTDGTLLDYAPVPGFTGLEAFTYTMTDSVWESMAVISMTVTEGLDGGVGGDAFTVPEMGDAQTFTVTVEIPNDVANGENVALVFDNTTAPGNFSALNENSAAPGGMVAAGLSFTLVAYENGRLVDESYQFEQPVTLTLRYVNAEVADTSPSENSLALYFAQKGGWANSGIQVLERDNANHQVTFAVSHAGSFALFRQGFIFIPLVMNNFAQAPDLVVKSLTVLSAGDQGVSGDIQVVIANEGNGPVTEEFWVDLYIDPKTAPTAVNQTWQMLGDQGFVWGVTTSALPLQPGERLTLTLSSPYARPALSNIKWPLSPGISIDVQVDSAKVGSPDGAVRELHEIYGEPYNNIRRFFNSS